MAESRLPKGPSNSAGMGATPGTQQTAANNVRSMNINPNMPVAPQLAKQARSSYQQSISTPPPAQAPKPVQPKQAPRPAGQRVVTQAMPMDPGRGYNIFSGMDAGQISNMNQSMGLSNMTNLPSMAPTIRPEMMGPQRTPQQFSTQLMSSAAETGLEEQVEKGNSYATTDSEGNVVVYEYDPTTGLVQKYVNGEKSGAPKDIQNINAGTDSDFEYFLESKGKKDASELTSDDLTDEAVQSVFEEEIGADQEKLSSAKGETEQKVEEFKQELEQEKQQAMSSLDDAYAIELQKLLSGIDRQMAMAGMFGSGAHSAAVSSVASQVLQGLLNEYNELNKQEFSSLSSFMSQELSDITQYNMLDLNFTEKDQQEYFQNLLAASQLLAQKEQLDEEDINEIMNIGEFMNSTVTDDLNSYIQGDVNNTDPVAKQGFLAILADIQFNLMQKTLPPNAELSVEEAVTQYTAAADLLSQAMVAYVTQSKVGQDPGEVMQYLNQLSEGYGISIPSLFDEFAKGNWSWT